MPEVREESSSVCPYINAKDARCSSCFNVAHLGEAFEKCFSHPEGCVTYHTLCRERREEEQAELERLQPITIHGKPRELRQAEFVCAGGGLRLAV